MGRNPLRTTLARAFAPALLEWSASAEMQMDGELDQGKRLPLTPFAPRFNQFLFNLADAALHVNWGRFFDTARRPVLTQPYTLRAADCVGGRRSTWHGDPADIGRKPGATVAATEATWRHARNGNGKATPDLASGWDAKPLDRVFNVDRSPHRAPQEVQTTSRAKIGPAPGRCYGTSTGESRFDDPAHSVTINRSAERVRSQELRDMARLHRRGYHPGAPRREE